MFAQRMLRSGPWSEAARSGKATRPAESDRRNADPVAEQAQEFARKLEDLAGVLANPLNEADAAWANANISMVAEEADDLISTLIDDAEGKGLEASGDWLPMPLVEQRAFEVPEQRRGRQGRRGARPEDEFVRPAC